ncbi:hypothetical protein PGO42_04190 [Klebsiella aerogenes]
MMKKFFRSIPVVFWLSVILFLTVVFGLTYSRKHPHTDLLMLMIFVNMSLISAYIIFIFSSSTFASAEKERLRGTFPGRKGKLKGIIRASSTLIVMFFIAAATAILGVGFKYGVFLLGIPAICFLLLFYNYYLLCTSRLKENTVKKINRVLLILCSVILFISKMFTNGFVNEFFDIGIAKVAYVGWAFSILFSIPFFVIASYFSCMVIGAVTDSSRVKKIKIPSVVHNSILCLSGVFFTIGYTSYFISAGGLFNAVAKEVYRYDTRSSFQCNNKYWIVPELGRDARYLMDTPNNYRAIYIENNSVHVAAVVCKKDGGYTHYAIESAEDIIKKQAPKEASLSPHGGR